MDDQGLNNWLREMFGTTIDGWPLFKLSWSTNLRETRRGTFRDFYGEIIIREVTEVRSCLKYPFAQDRWILERIDPTPTNLLGSELFQKYTYEEVYIFQDNKGRYIEPNKEITQKAVWLYFKLKGMSMKDKVEMRVNMLKEKERKAKERNREMIGDALRSPLFMPWIY